MFLGTFVLPAYVQLTTMKRVYRWPKINVTIFTVVQPLQGVYFMFLFQYHLHLNILYKQPAILPITLCFLSGTLEYVV